MKHQSSVRVLLELSGYTDGSVASEILESIQCAPDPETAIRYVFRYISPENQVLRHTWRKYISQTWFAAHPKVPKALAVPLQSGEVASASALLELYVLMNNINEHAPDLHTEHRDHFLAEHEEQRIAASIPLFSGDIYRVRRVCAIAEELRLIRPYKGRVYPVAFRYKEFQELPLSFQYYSMWHVDVYHLDWKEYFRDWNPQLVVFQQYTPMIWEMMASMRAGEQHLVESITGKIVHAFLPLWQQENEGIRINMSISIGMYEQSLLQGMVERWLVDGVFRRYGFIADDVSAIQWTPLGCTMMELERSSKLPCSTDVFL